jgi:hypothetical protein
MCRALSAVAHYALPQTYCRAIDVMVTTQGENGLERPFWHEKRVAERGVRAISVPAPLESGLAPGRNFGPSFFGGLVSTSGDRAFTVSASVVVCVLSDSASPRTARHGPSDM